MRPGLDQHEFGLGGKSAALGLDSAALGLDSVPISLRGVVDMRLLRRTGMPRTGMPMTWMPMTWMRGHVRRRKDEQRTEQSDDSDGDGRRPHPGFLHQMLRCRKLQCGGSHDLLNPRL